MAKRRQGHFDTVKVTLNGVLLFSVLVSGGLFPVFPTFLMSVFFSTYFRPAIFCPVILSGFYGSVRGVGYSVLDFESCNGRSIL